jgi:hypothetical protein
MLPYARIYAVFFLLTVVPAARGELYAPVERPFAARADVPSDTSRVDVRMPDQVLLDQFRQEAEYLHTQDFTYSKTLWGYIRYFFARLLGKLFDFHASSDWAKAGLYAALAAVAVFTAVKMFGIDTSGIFFREPPSSVDLSDTVLEENIHRDKLEAALEKALSERRYRLAARITYLIALKRLADAGQIQWKPDRTNRSYLHEIDGTPLREPFSRLTRLYEYVWYGDFDITGEHYRQIEADFNELNRHLR